MSIIAYITKDNLLSLANTEQTTNLNDEDTKSYAIGEYPKINTFMYYIIKYILKFNFDCADVSQEYETDTTVGKSICFLNHRCLSIYIFVIILPSDESV